MEYDIIKSSESHSCIRKYFLVRSRQQVIRGKYSGRASGSFRALLLTVVLIERIGFFWLQGLRLWPNHKEILEVFNIIVPTRSRQQINSRLWKIGSELPITVRFEIGFTLKYYVILHFRLHLPYYG